MSFAESVMGAGLVGIEFEGAAESFDGGEQLEIVLVDFAEIMPGLGVFGIEFEDAVEFFAGGIEIVHFEEQDAEVEQDFLIAGSSSQLSEKGFTGLIAITFGPAGLGDAVFDVGVVGIERSGLLPAPDGAVVQLSREEGVSHVVIAKRAVFF